MEVFAFVKAADESTAIFSREAALLSGYKDGLTIENDSDEIEVDGPIALASGKPETVNLKIKVPYGCTLEVDDAHFTATPGGEDSNIYTVSADGISAGAYPVTFTVKKGDEIIHVFSENINVFKGLCTDTWWNGSVSCEVKDVSQSISKTVYVRGTGGYYDTSPYNATATASDDNLGSFSSPFASIQKAVDTLIARNDGTSEYTIKVDGTLTQNTAVDHMAKISPSENLNLTIESMSADTNATLDAANNCRAMYIGGNANVKLKNIHITSGNGTGNGGGGIHAYNYGTSVSATVELFNVTISNCTATSKSGGGIFMYGVTLKMTGGTIRDCVATTRGGGVCNDKGSLTMSGVSIKNCSATTDGGGIYNNDTLTITGGIISECTATYNGGGIYLNSRTGNAVITNCTIKSCTANNIANGSAGGGGIYCYAQAFTITGGTISNCTSANQGGGISIDGQNFPFTIDGVEITDCNAKNGGGFFTVASATEGVTQEIKNCIIKSCTATTAGGGIGIYAGCNITVIDTEISDCVSPLGSGISSHNKSSLFLKDSTVKNDVGTRTDVASIYLAGSTAVTEGVINFSACTSTTSKPKLYVQDALTQSPIAKIKLGTVYQVGDAILQAADGYTLTEADCERFSIDGGIYDIALSDGEGVLVLKP